MPQGKTLEEIQSIVESERRLREAERLAKIGSWELDLINNDLVWSDEIYRIFDTTPQSFGATYDAFLGFIHPEDRDFVNDSYLKSVKNKEPYGPITHRLVMKNGTVKFVEERGNTVYDENGTPLRSYGICQDITERVIGEQTKAQLKEKEVLLKEIYHRVKNNLQLVSSLLNIQADKINDKKTREIFESNQKRISAIALVHEQLCRSDNLATVYANEFIQSLVDNYRDSALSRDDKIYFNLKITDATIAMDKAVPFGLIINEVVSNSVKHAFPNRSGTINIDLSKKLNNWELSIADDGKGIESISEIKNSNSFGMEIVRDLTEQLDGNYNIDCSPENGVKFDFIFPV